MTHPGRPAGGSARFLGIDQRLTLWPQAPQGCLQQELGSSGLPHLGRPGGVYREHGGGEVGSGTGDPPLGSNGTPGLPSGPSHPHADKQGLADL